MARNQPSQFDLGALGLLPPKTHPDAELLAAIDDYIHTKNEYSRAYRCERVSVWRPMAAKHEAAYQRLINTKANTPAGVLEKLKAVLIFMPGNGTQMDLPRSAILDAIRLGV